MQHFLRKIVHPEKVMEFDAIRDVRTNAICHEHHFL